MINRNVKGTKVEKLCLDSLSYYPLKWKTIRHKFLNIDLFGAFDVLVGNERHLRFIQVKTGYYKKEDYKKIKKVKLPPFCIKEIWEYFGKKKGWKKYIVP